MSVTAIVAVRHGPDAKSRLSPLLSPPLRRRLVEAMLLDLLDALADVRAAIHTVVATPDRSLAELAAARGTSVFAQPAPLGMADAFAHARAAAARGTHHLLLPADLPLATAPSIDALLAGLDPDSCRIVPAARDRGTNALLLPADRPFAFAYGPLSFDRHLAAAQDAGLTPQPMLLPDLQHDLDTPEDARRIAERGTGRAARLLAGHFAAARAA